MELRRFARLVRERLWFIVLAALVAGGVSWVVSQQLPKVYRASSTLLVYQLQDIRGLDYNSVLLSERLARTYADLARKPPVLTATIERLGLPIDVRRLAEQVDVRVIRDTQLLEIAVEHENPQLARDIAQTLAEVFIEQRVADQAGLAAFSREMLQQQIRTLEADMRQTSQALDEVRRNTSPDNPEALRLQNLLAQQQVTYSQLLRSDLDAALAESRAKNTLRVVVPAEVPTKPVRPNVPLNTALAAALGLLIALGILFLREALDNTIKNESDLATVTTFPVLATTPYSEQHTTTVSKGSNNNNQRQGALQEVYRVLRVNLDFSWTGEPGQVVAVASALHQEGKTTVATNLALVLAEDSRRVILVDCDLRRPMVHRALDLKGSQGLSNVLANPAAAPEAYLLPTPHQNLRVLPSGPLPPNPAELLGSQRFTQVLEQLRRIADIIVLDTPPLLAVADAAITASKSDGVILAVEAARTRRDELARAIGILTRGNARLLGLVLTKLPQQAMQYYYYSDYGSPKHAETGRLTKTASPS